MVMSLISAAVSTGVSAISSAVASIGPAVSSFVATVAPTISAVMEAVKPYIAVVSNFANLLLQGLGVLKPDEKIEDFGDRALQAAGQGVTIDKFECFGDYMNALRDFQLDPEVSAKQSQVEKLVAGIGVGTVGIEDKFNAERGSLNGIWLLPVANPDYFTPDRMQGLLNAGRVGGDILAYLEKRLSGGDAWQFEEKLKVNEDGKPMAEQEGDALYDALNTARSNWADLAKQIDARTNS